MGGYYAGVARRTVLITGASSGIGEAFAHVFASRGFDLVLTARREDRLRALAARLEREHGCAVHVIQGDLSRRDAPAAVCAGIAARGLVIDALVNNAGYGVPGSFRSSPWERHEAMLHVMVMAVAELTHALLPGMIDRGYGRIINVASLAGLAPAPAGHTLYAAVKALMIKFSESLSQEVERHGVHVTALCPGFTLSEFHDVTGTRSTVSSLPSWLWMDAGTVARQGVDAVMAGRRIYVNGRVNRTIAGLVKYMPQCVVDAVGRRTARRYRKV
jgi:short-subunit dehydrogenase